VLSFPPQTSENQKLLFALELCVFAQLGDGATAPSIEKQASPPPLRFSFRVFAAAGDLDGPKQLPPILPFCLSSFCADRALTDSSFSQQGFQ